MFRTMVITGVLIGFVLATSACHGEDRRAVESFAEAKKLVARSRSAQALPHLDTALEVDPKLHEARRLRARIRARQGNVAGAVDDLTFVLEHVVDDVEAQLSRARLFADRGDFARAVGEFEKVEDVSSDVTFDREEWADIYRRYGEELAASGDAEVALRCFGSSLDHDRTNVLARRGRGLAYAELGRHDEAQVDLEAVMVEHPNDGLCLRAITKCWLDDGEFDRVLAAWDRMCDGKGPSTLDEAIRGDYARALVQRAARDRATQPARALADQEQAVALRPEEAAFVVTLANMLCDQSAIRVEAGDVDGAIADLERVLTIVKGAAAKSADAHRRLAEIYARRDDFYAAIRHFDETVGLAPDDLEVRWSRGLYYERRGATESALADIEFAMAEEPKPTAERRKVRLRVLMAAKNHAAALDDATWLIDNGKDIDAFRARATIYVAKGRLHAAHDDLTQCIRTERRADLFAERAKIREEIDDVTGAIADATEAIRRAPVAERAELHELRGRLRHRGRDLDGALHDYSVLIGMQDDPGHRRSRAEVLRDKGDYVAALRDADHCLDADDEDVEALLIRVTIHSARQKFAAAETDLDRIEKLETKPLRALMHRAEIAIAQANVKDAKDAIDRLLGHEPDHYAALLFRAHLLFAAFETKKAIRDLRRAAKVAPDAESRQVATDLVDSFVRQADKRAALKKLLDSLEDLRRLR